MTGWTENIAARLWEIAATPQVLLVLLLVFVFVFSGLAGRTVLFVESRAGQQKAP